jgi:wobble nucleotide-excising tRNase
MLESLRMRGAPAFGLDSVASIGPLTPVTFIFGPNGSGKTTISRAFANPDRFPGTEFLWKRPTETAGVRVYNRDYVADTLKHASNLPGVFLLGKANAEIQAAIDGLSGPTGSIASAKKRLDDLADSLKLKKEEIAAARDELKESAWRRRSEVPSQLQGMFVGFGNSKEKLLNRLVEAAVANDTAEEDFKKLEIEAAAVLAEDAVQLEKLPLGRHLGLKDEPGFALLGTPVVGSGDVRLASLIEQLQNADWVEHGRHYLRRTDGLCPFCQQAIPAELIDQLNAYFDTRYAQQIEQLRELQKYVRTWADGWAAYFEDILGKAGVSNHLDIEDFQAARLQLEHAILRLTSTIETKLSGPSAAIEVADPAVEVDAVNNVVSAANTAISTFNLRLENRATAQKALLDRSWNVFARLTLATEVGRYEGAMPALDKGKAGLERAIRLTEERLKKQEVRLRELHAEVTSSKPIIDTINRLLESVGFHSFRLRESSAVKDGYSLVRENGEVASDSLSEGEQTFITFLYFAQSLQGAPQDSSESNELVAVIDDPISSLDSDVLYAVSTIVRRIIANIADGGGRVRQLVLLTHNAHFHKEVTYRAQSDRTGGWQYGIVRKRSGQPSELILSEHNPIQTAYAALWHEVRRSSNDSAASIAGLQNILRRILETYFKILGGVDNAEIVSKFTGVDQTICRALFAWVNAGSHSIFDDIDYSSTSETVEANLRVFRQIFKEQNQEGHYLMMMGETPDVAAATAEKPARAQVIETSAPDLSDLADDLTELVA